MVTINEKEIPVQVTMTALMNLNNPFYTMYICQAFSLLGRIQRFFLIVTALLISFSPLFYRGNYPVACIARDEYYYRQWTLLLGESR